MNYRLRGLGGALKGLVAGALSFTLNVGAYEGVLD